jgi:DNA-binding GntR family transcriptional regulator
MMSCKSIVAGGKSPPIKRGTASGHILGALREMIVGLELPPGSVIDKAALCQRFGVSRSPVSEALARLQLDGLVEILPQRGTLVARIHMADVCEAMFIRRSLEVEMVRGLASALNVEALGALGLNLEYQRLAVERADRRAFHELDLAFHEILFDQLGFARVRHAVETARNSLERARRLLSSPQRHAETLAEHRAIHICLERRDGTGAADAMTRHLDRVLDELSRLAADHPEIIETDGMASRDGFNRPGSGD